MDTAVDKQDAPLAPADGSLREVFADACRRYGDLTAYSCEGARMSFRELDGLSDAFAAWLLCESSLEPGDRVAIQLPNLLQYPVAALGVIKAGMVIVNINPLYTAGETGHQLRDCGVRALVALADIMPVTSRALPGTAVEKVIVTGAADLHPWHLKLMYRLAGLFSRRKPGRPRFSGLMQLTDVLRRGEKALRRQSLGDMLSVAMPASPRPELALIQYTGGTTGTAKGAMLSHANLMANMRQIDQVIARNCPPPGSVIVAPLPFYHIYAFTLNLVYSLYRGCHGVLIPDARNIGRMVKTLRRYRINGLVGVNTLFHVLCMHPDFRKLDFSGLRICTSGGMALSVSTARRWEKLTGCRILEGYGLTETSPLVASACYDDYQEGKIGRTTPWTEIRIIDSWGNTLGAGQPGEILVRGPQVMLGYWQKPQETSAVLDPDGWLHTGDIGILDAAGYLAVVDRIKDLILVSGFNVYPAEIEDHVTRHPDIREAAAIGVPLEEGEYVKLFVISDNPELTEEEITRFCRQGLTSYKVPKKIEFRSTLPRSNVGKILRRQLREDQVA